MQAEHAEIKTTAAKIIEDQSTAIAIARSRRALESPPVRDWMMQDAEILGLNLDRWPRHGHELEGARSRSIAPSST
jgi:hypothetical protein